jgi:hypothetical protein
MNVCFNGCSITVGIGFPVEQRDTYIYDQIVSRAFKFNKHNIAVGGSSNYKIFLRSAAAIISGQYNIVFSQWSALNRLWLSPGPDSQWFVNDEQSSPFSYRDIYLSTDQKRSLKNMLLLMNHDYQNILDLVEYCSILDQLAKLHDVRTVNINGLVPWQSDLVNPDIGSDLDASLSHYSKSILDFDHRDDKEILRFFRTLQEKVSQLDHTNWVNQFESIAHLQSDTGPEGHHPGPVTHKLVAEKIINHLKNIL